MGKRLKKMIILGIDQFQDPYYQGVAAQLAFFLFLSILPTIILFSQLMGLFSLSLDSLQEWANILKTMSGYSVYGFNYGRSNYEQEWPKNFTVKNFNRSYKGYY